MTTTPDTRADDRSAKDEFFFSQGEELLLNIELEERAPPVRLSWLIAGLCGFVALTLVWAGFTQVEEVVRAPGATVPHGDIDTIQHLDGGVIEAIHVEESQIVEAGAALIQLSPIQIDAELAQLRARRDQIRLSLERERSMVRDTAFTVSASADPDQALEQAQYWRAQREARERELASQRALIAEAQARHATVAAELADARSALATYQSEEAVMADLLERGLTRREMFNDAQRDVLTTTANVKRLEGQLTLAQREKAAAQARLEEINAAHHASSLSNSAALVSELAEIEAQITEASSRRDRLTIRTPNAGVVTDLAVRHANAVVKPGEALMRIVPLDRRLLVEARVPPRDIAGVSVGQPASVRVSAYDHARYGAIDGVIQDVSPTTWIDPDGAPYYRVFIAIEREHFGDQASQARLLSGMTVEADIKRGVRSLLSYWWRPVSRGWTNAFNEP